jgi:hypothetical protein
MYCLKHVTNLEFLILNNAIRERGRREKLNEDKFNQAVDDFVRNSTKINVLKLKNLDLSSSLFQRNLNAM